jgi:hypothetical protein
VLLVTIAGPDLYLESLSVLQTEEVELPLKSVHGLEHGQGLQLLERLQLLQRGQSFQSFQAL